MPRHIVTPKPDEHEALNYDGSLDDVAVLTRMIDSIPSWWMYREKGMPSNEYILSSSLGSYSIRPGNWVVKLYGDIAVYTKDEFELKFDTV